MTFGEFRAWAKQALGFRVYLAGGDLGYGGSQMMARILGLSHPGSGVPREYGPREKRRLWVYAHAQRLLGVNTQGTPKWVWEVMDRAEAWEGGPDWCLMVYRGPEYTTLWRLRPEELTLDRDGLGCLAMPWPETLN